MKQLIVTGIDSTAFHQRWRLEFSDGGLTLPIRGLKYGLQGTINAKNLRKIAFHLPTGGQHAPTRGL